MSGENGAQSNRPEDFIWQTYLNAAKPEDEARPKSWEGSTTGILTFTGMFAATVAAFIIESYKMLSVDSGTQSAILLSQLLAATANMSSNNPVIISPPEPFSTSSTVVITNALWFSSLLIALVCALLSTLVQEWSRNYVYDINRRTVLHESLRTHAFNHIFIRMGVNCYGMDQFVSWIVALVHLSVFLFAGGLLVFLFPINHIVAGIATCVLGAFIIVYVVASLLPLLDKSCPYRAPVSYLMASIYWIALRSRTAFSYLIRKDAPGYKPDYSAIIARQYTGGDWEFMIDSRFVFAWEHTYVHITDQSCGSFLKALPSLIDLHESREMLLSRLCANDSLMMSLFRLHTDMDNEIFKLVALISERAYAPEVMHHGECLDDNAITSPMFLSIISHVSLVAEVDGPFQLSARLCLAYVRRSLLNLARQAFEKELPPLHEEEVQNVFREINRFNKFRLGDRNPCDILLVLVTGSTDGYFWSPNCASSLLPLHDNDCCKDWRNILTPEGLAHVAACNSLSIVAHILASTDNQRRHAESLLQFVPLIPQDRYTGSQIPDNGGAKMPSPEFVSILCSAGLKEWLEPGSKFITGPSERSNFEFLPDNGRRRCVGALRRLAQDVDFAAYRARNAPARPPMLPAPSSNEDDSPAVVFVSSAHTMNVSARPHTPRQLLDTNSEIERCSNSVPINTRVQEGMLASAMGSLDVSREIAIAPTPFEAVLDGQEPDGAHEAPEPATVVGQEDCNTSDDRNHNHGVGSLGSQDESIVSAASASKEHPREEDERVTLEDVVAASTPLNMDGEKHKNDDPLGSPGLRSVLVV